MCWVWPIKCSLFFGIISLGLKADRLSVRWKIFDCEEDRRILSLAVLRLMNKSPVFWEFEISLEVPGFEINKY